MSNVKLAVRVRPLTERERKNEKENIAVVNVLDQNTVNIINVKVNASGAGDSRERVRSYYADYTFDSSCDVTHANYASQEKVFESIGRDVLSCMSSGSSACVIAYGQSATGKTFTMMGTDSQLGLVPRLCRELALVDGFCVTVRVVVYDAETLLSLVNEGALRRHTAATRRNPSSSRSHALLELSTPAVTLHLADLAGSEKASWEGCGGGRQKEGANINKSLVALSNVISALVSTSCGRRRFVPYRDSALTWLLKDCFTGGARTYIIATVSPSVSCYGESASTLRWAAQARQLPEPRTFHHQITSSRTALQAQLKCLLSELIKHHIIFTPETGKITFEDLHWTLNPLTNQDKQISFKEMNETKNHNSESTASSVASDSLEVIHNTNKTINLDQEIDKEVDEILGPALERTRSGCDLKNTQPFIIKPRHYRSHEVFPMEYQQKTISNLSLAGLTEKVKENIDTKSLDTDCNGKNLQHIPIMSDQRAEIVASVTERLYSKLKKKEGSAASKMESVIDKKIMEPLSELKICANARQRLIEMSKKAMRNKRKIGIPAFTQTRVMAKRVKDKAVDVQNDLKLVFVREKMNLSVQDASTETENITPRYKEASVGSKSGSILCQDNSTITDVKLVQYKDTISMTNVLLKSDCFTQTDIMPPPRRKRISSMRKRNIYNEIKNNFERLTPSIININISQSCDTDSEVRVSDDEKPRNKCKSVPHVTPDLISNHSTTEISTKDEDSDEKESNNNLSSVLVTKQSTPTNDFPETGDHSLPRVSIQSYAKTNNKDIEDLILGHNHNVYPYNIVLSPPRERERPIVRFKDCEDLSKTVTNNNDLNTSYDTHNSGDNDTLRYEDEILIRDPIYTHNSDSSDCSKYDSNSFIWQKKYDPVFKQTQINALPDPPQRMNLNKKYKTTKAKIYKEFLGLEKTQEWNDKCCQKCDTRKSNVRNESDSDSEFQFRKTRQFFEEKMALARDNKYEELEETVLKSCDRLEASINRYDVFLNKIRMDKFETNGGRPTAYLQHLVQLRRNFMEEVN